MCHKKLQTQETKYLQANDNLNIGSNHLVIRSKFGLASLFVKKTNTPAIEYTAIIC